MPSIRQSIRSSTASKRPTSAIADGQIALNTASGTPGMFFKDGAGNIIKAGPAHYGASAPNSSPAVGGSTGNSIGEAWLDSSLTPAGWKIWNGSAFVNATPLSSDTVQGLVELATNAETQAGVDTARAVTSASLQSKVSDSISTASASGIASSAAVKTAYDLANAALPKSGGIITGNLEIGSTGSLTFEGSTADGFETTLAVVDPTLDRTITFPNITGTVVTTGDTGTVTSTMILDGTIVDADINASAEIAVSKLADGAARQLLQTDAAGTGVEWASNIDIPGTLDVTSAATFDSTVAVTGALTKSGNNVVTVGDTGTVTSTMILDGTILNADVNASAAIAGTKISPDFGSQNTTTTGTSTAASFIPTSSSVPTNGVYLPAANSVAISTNGTQRITIDSSGRLLAGTSTSRNGGYADPAQVLIEGLTYRAAAQSIILNSNDGNGASLNFGKSRGTSLNSNTIVQNGDFLGVIDFAGADGSALKRGAVISAEVDGTPGANDMPGRLVFSTTADGGSSPSERLRITSAGLVGIGTSGPQSQLQVLDQIRVSSSAQSQGSIVLGDGSSTAFNVGIARWNGTTNAAGAGGIGYFSQGAGNVGGHYFYTGDAVAGSQTARMIVNPSGNVGIGTSPSNANGGILQLSSGITFPATAVAASDPNTLDDYEEGTFTPTAGAGITINSGTPAYSGFYTKIGRMVHVSITQTAGNITATVGAGTVFTGLPFTPGTALQACSVTNGNPDISGTGLIYNSPGTGAIYIGFTAVSQTNLTFTGTYFI